MLRLVQNLNFYIMFEVLECSWKNLSEKLSEAKDMDQVIAANENFIETIISQLLLDPKSKVKLQVFFFLNLFSFNYILI
jgi:gamma-tubulin complex component 3